MTIVDVTAISTPFDSVPLYNVQFDKEPIMLLKSSQAVSSSDRLNAGTPAKEAHIHECRKQVT